MIATWNAGTALAGKRYDIDGTLANRTGDNLARAIEAEVLLGAGTVTVLNTTDVHIAGSTVNPAMTLSDGEIDRPVNDSFAGHVGYLVGIARGDLRTLMKSVMRRIIRYYKRRGVGRAAFLTAIGNLWDAVTIAGD